MQESLYQTADAEYLHQTADAGDTPSESVYRRHSIRQRMQESLHQTVDARVFLSHIGCRRVKNDADLLLRVRQDKKSRVENDADLFLRVR